jgi:hypothetical protein
MKLAPEIEIAWAAPVDSEAGAVTERPRMRELLLAATLFAREPATLRSDGSAGLHDDGGPLAGWVNTLSPV